MDESTNERNTEGALSMLPTIPDSIGPLVASVPAPIVNNAIRAFSRLCTAVVDIPVAILEGVAAEKRAESSARVKIITTSGKQIEGEMDTNPEYGRAAVVKFSKKILRERVNIDQIAYQAAEELKNDASGTNNTCNEVPPISEDWLNVFESEAAQMSSEQMQNLFAKILAGEIRRPSSYSIRTVKVLAQLDNTTAHLFKVLCSLCISLRIPDSGITHDARVVSMGSAGNNSLQAYDLSFNQLNILEENGLIISDYNSWRDYRIAIARDGQVQLPFLYEDKPWAFVPKAEATTPSEVKVYGVAFTHVGKELLAIVDKQPNEQYSAALRTFFDQQGMVITPVNITSGTDASK